MFKFNIKINNVHNFKLKVGNTFEFISKASQATILKKLFIRNTQKSDLTIGGTKLKLASFSNYKLRELPSTLRQFVGSYVYVKAKMRFASMSTSISKLTVNILMRLRPNELYAQVVSVKGKLLAKMRFTNKSLSVISLKNVLWARARFTNSYLSTDSKLIHRLVLKTKPAIQYITSTTARARLKCKVKIAGVHKSIKTLAISVTAKMRLDNAWKSTHELHGTIVAKCKINNKFNSTNTLGTIPLKGYKDVKLKDLPTTLREFMNSYVRVLCKVRFYDVNSTSTIVSRCLSISKARISDASSNSVDMDGSLAKSIPLTTYSNTKLNELPTSLRDFSFNRI